MDLSKVFTNCVEFLKVVTWDLDFFNTCFVVLEISYCWASCCNQILCMMDGYILVLLIIKKDAVLQASLDGTWK